MVVLDSKQVESQLQLQDLEVQKYLDKNIS